MRICQKCAKEKNVSEFYGRMKTCKICHQKDMANARIKGKERADRREKLTNRHTVKVGDTFFAIIKDHLHARNILGRRGFAGQTIGEFVCTDPRKNVVIAGSRQFNVDMFAFEVITE